MKHYYIDNDLNSSSAEQYYCLFMGKKFIFNTNQNVFSKNKLDYGTKALLSYLDINTMHGRVLDLGCGYGAVGIILKKLNPTLLIDMTDVTSQALTLAASNLHANQVNENKIFYSDIYSNVTDKYDYIITNPPIRAGKKVVTTFLMDALNHLQEDGSLYYVMRKNHGALSMKKNLETKYIVELLGKDHGFYIFKAKKR